MAKMQYESKDDGGTGSGRRATAAMPSESTLTGLAFTDGSSPLEGRSIGKGTALGRDETAEAVSQALEELPR